PRAMHIYDPATDAWTTSPDSIPEGVNHAGLVYLDGKLYLVGGFRGATFDPIDAVWIYDIAAGTWTAGPPLPTARGAMAVAVLNGKIHVIGGNAANAGALNPAEHNVGPDASSVGTHEVFDPATGQWTRLPPMPTARNHAGAAVLNGRIHVFAGRVGSNDTLTRSSSTRCSTRRPTRGPPRRACPRGAAASRSSCSAARRTCSAARRSPRRRSRSARPSATTRSPTSGSWCRPCLPAATASAPRWWGSSFT